MLASVVAGPAIFAIAVVTSMVGRGGGNFYVPTLVVSGMPMRIVLGISSVIVAVTVLVGFLGHTVGRDFNPAVALALAGAAVLGGLVGRKVSIRGGSGNTQEGVRPRDARCGSFHGTERIGVRCMRHRLHTLRKTRL